MNRDPLQRDLESRNRQTSANWASFESHRQRLRRLLEEHSPSEARSICILGAGNANDLDLPWLADRFERIVLVDLDVEAMRQGVERQLGSATPPGLEMARLDVTGVYDRLDRIAASSLGPADNDLHGLQERLKGLPALGALPKFDCVLSTCLLSQLIAAVKTALGERHPQFLSLVRAIRGQHLETALQLASNKGFVAIVFDFVSSLTCPDLPNISEAQVPGYAAEQLERQNFFTGLNPSVVCQAFTSHVATRGQAGSPVLTPPWRWDLGPRTYLVAAVLARLA